jgi:hypothetical protein
MLLLSKWHTVLCLINHKIMKTYMTSLNAGLDGRDWSLYANTLIRFTSGTRDPCAHFRGWVSSTADLGVVAKGKSRAGNRTLNTFLSDSHFTVLAVLGCR